MNFFLGHDSLRFPKLECTDSDKEKLKGRSNQNMIEAIETYLSLIQKSNYRAKLDSEVLFLSYQFFNASCYQP